MISSSPISGAPIGGSRVVAVSSGDLTAVGFVNVSLFGTHSLNANLAPSSLINVSLFGSDSLNANLAPASLVNAQAFGTQALNANLAPASLVNVQTFGTQAINATLSPAGVLNVQVFGTESLNANLVPASLVNVSLFGVPFLDNGETVLFPVGFVNSQAFGTPTLTAEPFVHDRGQARKKRAEIEEEVEPPQPHPLNVVSLVNHPKFGQPTIESDRPMLPAILSMISAARVRREQRRFAALAEQERKRKIAADDADWMQFL